jgi:hypothetical protein
VIAAAALAEGARTRDAHPSPSSQSVFLSTVNLRDKIIGSALCRIEPVGKRDARARNEWDLGGCGQTRAGPREYLHTTYTTRMYGCQYSMVNGREC